MNISVILLIIYHFKIGKIKYKYQDKHIIAHFNFGLVGLTNLLHLTNKDVQCRNKEDGLLLDLLKLGLLLLVNHFFFEDKALLSTFSNLSNVY